MNSNNSNNSEEASPLNDDNNELDITATTANIYREPVDCTCVNDNSHFTIKFFNKTVVVCPSNKNERSVINLSSVELSPSDRSLLLRGLKFCPTPGEPKMVEIKKDLRSFFRRLRLRDFYYVEDDSTPHTQNQTLMDQYLTPSTSDFSSETHNKFKPPSTWDPESHQVDPAIETFCRAVMADVSHYIPRAPRTQNLSQEENQSLKDLTDTTATILKKADKGSAVVLMDLADYKREAYRQLNDPKYYVEKSEDLTQEHSSQIERILDQMVHDGEIETETYNFLKPQGCRTPLFYFLPKIHKKLVVGRPIISGNGGPTEKISAFVDEHIKGYVKEFPSYVRDTTDFISKIENYHSENEIILLALDVSGLYTNIPNQEGKMAVNRTLVEKNYEGKVSRQSLMRLLDCVLHKNNFDFYDKHYLQIGGTAMGSSVAPSYANIFMGYLEKRLLENAPHKPDVYLRFIDDIFCVFSSGMQSVDEFIEYMNSAHHSIKFTAEKSKEQMPFLDTLVKVDKQTNTIYTELYTKDTDTHNYLSFDSCHPKHCKTGGPYGEFLRIRRNCTKLEDYDKHSLLRMQDYQRRGYPENILTEARNKARNLDRKTLFQKKDKTNKNSGRIPCILTWNPANPDMKSILDKHWHLLELCDNKEAFAQKPLISYRRPKNLADYLIRAKVPTDKPPDSKPATNPNMKPCKTPWNCPYCPKKRDGRQYFTSSQTGRRYKSPVYTCNTKNVIYLITCTQCKMQYVGETSRTFKERMKEHEGYVKRKQTSKATGFHFNQRKHQLGHMKYEVIFCLWKKPVSNDPVRVSHEIKWAEQLQTFKPKGLNVKGK